MSSMPWKRYLAALVVTLLAACSASGNPFGGDAAQGQKVTRAHCVACHGADGNSANPAYPRLAGLDANYLYSQLVDFRSGTRPSQVMGALAASLSDEDMRDAADYYAGQSHGHDAPGPSDLMAQGRQLFLYGSSDGYVVACASCHAPGAGGFGHMGGGMGMHRMMGPMMRGGNAPSLYGQHAAYVVSQLEAFAHGTRPATVMGRIAGAMTRRQAQAVAAYVAAHP